MRKALDIILTINLLVLALATMYFWASGRLQVEFTKPQATIDSQSLDTLGYVFGETLKDSVQTNQGEPSAGYKPDMFLKEFPGLVSTDFEDVEASIGKYTVVEGQLVHVTPPGALLHNTPDAISRRGFETLLQNVATRTGIDIKNEGTITQVMAAISY